jgi:hypothetical protein
MIHFAIELLVRWQLLMQCLMLCSLLAAFIHRRVAAGFIRDCFALQPHRYVCTAAELSIMHTTACSTYVKDAILSVFQR